MINRLLIFDLTGKFACWKKFYSNSSSLTYEIPPRTSIIGILASILELPRDSYYEKFSSENCNISLAIKSKLKKKFYCMNYFKKPNQRDYTQVRLEVLTPKNIQEEVIKYRIYVYLNDDNLFDKLVRKIKERSLGFGIYLGQRQFRGDVEYIDDLNLNKLKNGNKLKIVENVCEINSVVNLKNLKNKEEIENTDYVVETVPIDFNFCGTKKELNTNITNREIQKTGRVTYTTELKPLRTKSHFKKALEILYKGEKETICFYEEEFS